MEVALAAWATNFALVPSIQIGSGTQLASCPMCSVVFILGNKAGRGFKLTTHLHPECVQMQFHSPIRLHEPVTAAERSKAWTVFTRADAGTVCSNPTQGMDVNICVVCVFFCVCVQVEASRRADHPSKGSYRLSYIYNWSETESFMEAAKAWIGPYSQSKKKNKSSWRRT
jgi:hypothetical protein